MKAPLWHDTLLLWVALQTSYHFTVSGPPRIAGTNPSPLAHQLAEQSWTFEGNGFMSGLNVKLTGPNGAAVTVTITSVTSTAVGVKAVLATAGRYQAAIVTPPITP